MFAVDHASHPLAPDHDRSPGTLGEVLYANPSRPLVSEAEWVGLVHLVAAGDQAALQGLYERAHRVVFTLIMRITANRETAEEVTIDVFHDVWRRASSYKEAGGTVLGWVMNQARSRAIDRLRFEQQSQALRRALNVLTPDEREAIETAFFSELTYAEVATQLNQPLGTVKTRIRSGLLKLRETLAEGGHRP